MRVVAVSIERFRHAGQREIIARADDSGKRCDGDREREREGYREREREIENIKDENLELGMAGSGVQEWRVAGESVYLAAPGVVLAAGLFVAIVGVHSSKVNRCGRNTKSSSSSSSSPEFLTFPRSAFSANEYARTHTYSLARGHAHVYKLERTCGRAAAYEENVKRLGRIGWISVGFRKKATGNGGEGKNTDPLFVLRRTAPCPYASGSRVSS